MEATAGNKAVIVQMKSAAVRRSAKEKSEAELLVDQIQAVELTFERKAGEREHIFGSVTAADVAKALEEKGFKVDRRKIALYEPLKQLGEFEVPVKLHREVTARVKVVVKSDGTEPEPEPAPVEEVRGTYNGPTDEDE